MDNYLNNQYQKTLKFMITIRYFASLRDQLGCGQEQLPWQNQLSTVSAIKQHLAAQDNRWQTITTVLVAVNQQMANDNTMINDGDEVAFFPPVTGG